MIVVGVCGGSGSGKSSLCDYLRFRGYTVADCDRIYREIVQPPSKCLEQIVAEFGDVCLAEDGSLDRAVLRQLVFSDPVRLQRLNGITFTHITDEVKKLMSVCKTNKEKIFFIDAPLLFESGLNEICHHTLCVIAPYHERVRRLCLRDGLCESQIRARLERQLSEQQLREKCTDVIENLSDLRSMYQAMDALLKKWEVE